jgi:hypothetical protein
VEEASFQNDKKKTKQDKEKERKNIHSDPYYSA